MRYRLLAGLLIWALFAVQCGKPLEKIDTLNYRIPPPIQLENLEKVENALAAEYGAQLFRQLLYSPGTPLSEPGRKEFISPQPENGSVVVRELGLNHLRIQTYLDSIYNVELNLDSLPQEETFAFRVKLFETEANSILEAYHRSRITSHVTGRLASQQKIRPTGPNSGQWDPQSRIYDPWNGEFDVICTPPKWAGVHQFLENHRPSEISAGYESIFSSGNAALYYYRATQMIEEVTGTDFHSGIFTQWDSPSASAIALIEQLKPYQFALDETARALSAPLSDMKALIPQTPHSPQPVPREEMLALARLWAAQSLRYRLAGEDEKAIQAALGVLKMGWDWNQGPAGYRHLSTEIVDIGCGCTARILVPGRSRGVYQAAFQALNQHEKDQYPSDFDSYFAELQSFTPEALLSTPVMQNRLKKEAEDAYLAGRIAYAQTRVMLLRAATLLYHYDRKSFPDSPNALAPQYLREIPQDPFNGSTISYEYSGQYPLIYSWGPDEKNNYGRLAFNPEKGLTSEGDLFFP